MGQCSMTAFTAPGPDSYQNQRLQFAEMIEFGVKYSKLDFGFAEKEPRKNFEPGKLKGGNRTNIAPEIHELECAGHFSDPS